MPCIFTPRRVKVCGPARPTSADLPPCGLRCTPERSFAGLPLGSFSLWQSTDMHDANETARGTTRDRDCPPSGKNTRASRSRSSSTVPPQFLALASVLLDIARSAPAVDDGEADVEPPPAVGDDVFAVSSHRSPAEDGA